MSCKAICSTTSQPCKNKVPLDAEFCKVHLKIQEKLLSTKTAIDLNYRWDINDFTILNPLTNRTISLVSVDKCEDLTEVGKSLGALASGGFGAVFVARYKPTKQVVVLKIMDQRYPEADIEHNMLYTIYSLTAKLPPNTSAPIKHIVEFYGAFVHNQKKYLVLEYIPTQNFKQMRHEMTLKQRLQCTVQIAETLLFLEEKCNMLHRDIKLRNILIQRDTNVAAKLCDFGLACLSYNAGSLFHNVGTTTHKSPEMYDGTIAKTSKTDVWSLAIVFYEILHDCLPFRQTKSEEEMVQFLRDQYQCNLSMVPRNYKKHYLLFYEDAFSEQVYEEWMQLLENCLAIDVNRRLSLARLVAILRQLNNRACCT